MNPRYGTHMRIDIGDTKEAQQFVELVLDRELQQREELLKELDGVREDLDSTKVDLRLAESQLSLYRFAYGEKFLHPMCPHFCNVIASQGIFEFPTSDQTRIAYGRQVLSIHQSYKMKKTWRAHGSYFSYADLVGILSRMREFGDGERCKIMFVDNDMVIRFLPANP